MSDRRSRLTAGCVTLAVVALVVGCSPLYQEVPFTPGTWSDDATNGSVTLNADGSGSVVNVPYVVREGRGFCLPDETYLSYTGQVQWRWGNDNSFIYLDMTAGRRDFAEVAPWRQDDWTKLEYWACGDHDLPGNVIFKLDLETPTTGSP
jgi:hypothetical protein